MRRTQPEKTSALTAEEISSEIYHGMLSYSEHAASFEQWWRLLPKKLQRELNSAAEDYASIGDYHQHLQSGSAVILRSVIVVPARLYVKFCNGLPRLTQTIYERLVSMPEGVGRSKLLRTSVEHHVRQYERYVKAHFGLGSKEPANEVRDRLFSKWNYEGLTFREIAERWYGQSGTSISGEAVKKAISRSREERRIEAWEIRLLIFETGFPQLLSLTCKACFGTGEAPHPDWSEAQRQWYEKWSKIGWLKWRPTDCAPDADHSPVVPCAECNATGKLKVRAISSRTK